MSGPADLPGRPPPDLLIPAPPFPVPVLFLVGDTGGGHRSAALAVSQALTSAYPGRFRLVICDPVTGAACPRRQRWITGLYAPGIRLTPWLWGFFWHRTNTPGAVRWLYRTVFAPVQRVVDAAVTACRPAAIVAFHPMTIRPAVTARDRHAPGVPVATVVTDLVSTHWSWRDSGADLVMVPTAAVGGHYPPDPAAPDRCRETGLPVGAGFAAGPPSDGQRRALRESLGVPAERFLVVMTGGAEGSGGLSRRAVAVLAAFSDVQVAVICGRNRYLRRRLSRLAGRAAGRLTVCGYVANMAEWLRSADLVVTKAGPSTIAEAACCGTPLILTSHVPGQEAGNADLVAAAGAGRRAATVRQLVAEIGALRDDPGALAGMRAAAVRLGRPGAAASAAAVISSLASRGGAGAETGGHVAWPVPALEHRP